ncbi:MAG: trypsin-like peptidase domain-containing protein [Alphaproteobacteria bacterium]|nr:trypsin-like peptidase domain-containing protein [Alphaproteobacteria bacterium]MCB9931291.1 trypsin-like peptidase domain-containing protein [Alphaproteobacteria bacterium]
MTARAYGLLALAVTAVALTAPSASRAGSGDSVHCYDPARQMVRPTAAADCRGRVVGPAEAAALRAQRARYVRRAVTAPPQPHPAIIGSGIFVSDRGDVLTNRHVIDSCRAISVLQPDGRTVPARVIARSRMYDLGLLRTGKRPTETAAFAPQGLTNGHPVAITGFPVYRLPPVRPQTIEGRYLNQRQGGTDGIMVLAAAVMPGASGSPVVNRSGAVAGLVFARNDTTRMPTAFGNGSHDTPPDRTYAIPTSALQRFLSAHGVPFRMAKADDAEARSYTVRVNCYRNSPRSQ